jgi:hypothetical protein
MALGVAVLLAGCSAKSPTAPKPQPTPSAFNISLTPESSTAQLNEPVVVVAQVTSGSGNAPDGTSVTFVASAGGFSPVQLDKTGKIVGPKTTAVTTSGGHAAVTVTSDVAATVTITAGVPGGTSKTAVTFYEAAPPTPTPTPTPTPDYTPKIYTLTPNQGPMEGGTRLTITGTGFQTPVQVTFGRFQAQVVSSDYKQVVCISPNVTGMGQLPPLPFDVQVLNLGNGLISNAKSFIYGLNMFISSFTPIDGPADTPTTVTIFGYGFVAPVNVIAVTSFGVLQWDILSVAGTEIIARSKPIPEGARTCADAIATLSVTNIDSGATVGSTLPFTYRAIRPLITSVQIDGTGNSVTQYLPGTCNLTWASHTVTIRGSGFQQGMTVSFGGIGPFIATFVDANTLTLRLPDLTGVGLNSVPCNDGGGAGNRFVATGVSVIVANPHNSCSDMLNNGIIINPCVTTCQVLPAPTVTSISPDNGPIAGGTSVIIGGTNFVNSGLSVTIGGAPATGVTFIDANNIQAITPAHTPAGGPLAVTVFCGGQSGTNPSAFTYTATMAMTIVGTGQVDSSVGPLVGTSPCTSGTCNWTFNNSVVTLTVTTTGTFDGWAGSSCGCTGTTTPCTVTMNQNRACTASFTP